MSRTPSTRPTPKHRRPPPPSPAHTLSLAPFPFHSLSQSGAARGSLRLELCFLLGETGRMSASGTALLPPLAMLTDSDASEPPPSDESLSGSGVSGRSDEGGQHAADAPATWDDGAGASGGYGPLGESARRLSQAGDVGGGGGHHYHTQPAPTPPTAGGPHGPSRFSPYARDGGGGASASRRATHDGGASAHSQPTAPSLIPLASTYSAVAALLGGGGVSGGGVSRATSLPAGNLGRRVSDAAAAASAAAAVAQLSAATTTRAPSCPLADLETMRPFVEAYVDWELAFAQRSARDGWAPPSPTAGGCGRSGGRVARHYRRGATPTLLAEGAAPLARPRRTRTPAGAALEAALAEAAAGAALPVADRPPATSSDGVEAAGWHARHHGGGGVGTETDPVSPSLAGVGPSLGALSLGRTETEMSEGAVSLDSGDGFPFGGCGWAASPRGGGSAAGLSFGLSPAEAAAAAAKAGGGEAAVHLAASAW